MARRLVGTSLSILSIDAKLPIMCVAEQALSTKSRAPRMKVLLGKV